LLKKLTKGSSSIPNRLHKFLDNAKKQFPDFEYIWVAERQTKNPTFPGNIHFHIITNQYWNFKLWNPYWVELQERMGIIRRNQAVMPGSFDARKIQNDDKKRIGNYLTKYVTKNNAQMDCQVWHCSKKISALQTDFYGDMQIIDQVRRLEAENLLEGVVREYPGQYCNVFVHPINDATSGFYKRLDDENKRIWDKLKNKEVADATTSV
jgi:hypothetical protein